MTKLLALLIAIPAFGWSQVVPREMDFGSMRLTFTESARKQIQRDVDRLTTSPTYYGILVDRMNLYFPIIERAFEENNVPDEIKFLAIQESALISDAVSSANAVGFWQFKDFTAREVGLTVDRSIDERLNIVGASYGAAKYLNTNNFFYDNWIYSVMAYNTGRGGAEKYVDASLYGAKNMTIDTKTHWYVKKFLAHVVAFSPSVGLPHSDNIWLLEETETKGKSLEAVSKKHKVNIEEVKKYNKWLKRGSVPSEKSYTVLIPKQGTPPKRMIASNSKRSYQKIIEPSEKIYPTEIKPGINEDGISTIIPINGIPAILARVTDDAFTLALAGGINEPKLRKYNDLGPEDKIVANEFYYVKKKKGKSKVGFHVAKMDESLWDISQRYGIQLTKLAKKNRMSIIDDLEPGRVVWLKKTRPASEPIAYHKAGDTNKKSLQYVARAPKVTYDETDKIEVPKVDSSEELRKVKIHTVAAGESLWGIAQKYNVQTDDLLRWNELPDPNSLSVGQNLQVKAPIEEAVADKTLDMHTVEAGQTLYAISRLYDMTVDEIMDLNELKSTDLAIGMKLKVVGKN